LRRRDKLQDVWSYEPSFLAGNPLSMSVSASKSNGVNLAGERLTLEVKLKR
jgi:hypothetical protein